MQQVSASNEREIDLYRIDRVCERTGLSKATIYRLEARGEFPKRTNLGARISVWRSDLVSDWIASRTAVDAS